MAGGDQSLSLAELARKSGVAPRTIRFYIARGLLAGPRKAGRGARYEAEHLARLREIRAHQDEGLTLVEVARRLGGAPRAQVAADPAPWWLYRIADDVTVQVRANAAPWRARRIQSALAQLATSLADEA